jgi:hypothetical protein
MPSSTSEAWLGGARPLLYQAQLWVKYQNAFTYEQTHHRDYGKNTMLIPAGEYARDAVAMFVLLTDVTDRDGPTAVVSRCDTAHLPLEPARYARDQMPALYERERLMTGPAGSVLAFGLDTFHRATEITRPRGARLVLKLAFKRSDATWIGYHAGLRIGFEPEWGNFVRGASRRQLEAVGFPVDDSDRGLLAAVAARYDIDAACAARGGRAAR